ncbi:MAG: hypothetical protein A2945_04945 [Candidatus Liptonbacteria bacterium RIFCSPLOWO2_01_FULL_52_25]|uniref:Uncharacterized protein n=1 Tax=Candidatus Liptonbacteria bacterium RIFCSPLOWO2_01_FULL_52_25 TaxID=1798650 RepID=A0A1G2CD30_9BACT|nr:MAG: hypothetical protein A2945_04945 [Candidatus Liptonbacteria bacterium RIFCSPLOWO2_01_FULL_52_25]
MVTKLNTKNGLGVVIFAVALLSSYAIFVHAQDAGIPDPNSAVDEGAAAGITFPVAELGNCNSKEECKTYCNDSSHMDACIAFAESHGLMNKEDASRAKKFKETMRTGGGPGGCTNPRDCKAFCSDTTNLEVCVNFAKQQGIKDKHVEQGEKVLAHIKAGGKMPGGCTSEESCQAYCGDFSHAEECFNFAKRAGIMQEGPRGEGPGGRDEPTLYQLQQLSALMKNGETPGGCTSKDSCEAYCRGGEHVEECIAFGEKVGFIKPDEAQMIRKTGGKGPGECTSRESCEAYCNDPTHREECFNFAKEHGLISEEDVKRTQEGFVQLRAGLEQAPPEVAECMKTTLGQNIIGDIQSGNLVPGPEIGERVRACFEKFGHRGNPQTTFRDVPTAVRNCLQEKIGASELAEISAGASSPTPEMADAIRVCMQSVQFEQGFSGGRGGEQGYPGPGGGGQGFGGPPSIESFRNFVNTAPPEVASCIKEQLGGDIATLQAGGGGPIDTSKVRVCFEQFKPQMPPQSFGPGGQGFPGQPGVPPQGFGGGIEECVRQMMGTGATDKDTAMRTCIEKMQGTSGEGTVPKPFPLQTPCPKMPTVSECPTGQKLVSREIPGCGVYASCTSGTDGAYPTNVQYPPTTGVQQVPSTYVDCARKLFGDAAAERIRSGQITPEEKLKLSQCVSGSAGSTGGQYPSPYPTNQYPTGGTQYPTPYPLPTDSGTQSPAVLCAQKGGSWIEDKVAGSYCHFPTPEEKLRLQQQYEQYQQQYPTGGTYPPPTTVYPPPPDGGTYTAPPPTYEPAPLPPPTQSSRRGGFLGAIGNFFRWLFN